MSRGPSTFALAMVAVLALAHPSSAVANKAKARPIFLKANKAYKAGQYKRALALYEQAYAVFPSEKILLNQATCLVDLGRPAAAATLYLQYVRESKDARRRALVRTQLHELAQKVGRVKIPRQPKATRIYVDGDKHDDLPPTIVWLSPGTHTIALRKGDDKRIHRVRVTAGSLTDLSDADKRNDDGPSSEGTEVPIGRAEAHSSRGNATLRMSSYAVGLAGLVALGAAVKYGLDVRSLEDELSGTEQAWTPELQAQHERGERAEKLMYVFSGIGAAALVGGAALFYFSSANDKAPTVTVSGNSMSIGIAGRF